MKHPLHALAALLLCLTPLLAQDAPGDPREVDDPRDKPDPRFVQDPRINEHEDRPLQPDNLEGDELLDHLWERGATPVLLDAMREQAWLLLPYIDRHCEQWLAMVEDGALEDEERRPKADALVAKARELAQLADNALRDTRYSNYVLRFTSWTEEEQVRFREGQQQYGLAMRQFEAAESPLAAMVALTALQRSIDLARPLGDAWGQSMSWTAIGRIQLANAKWVDARTSFRNAVEIGRTIRDLDSVWLGLTGVYETSLKLRELDVAKQALIDQLEIARQMGDDQRAQHALNLMLVLNETMKKVEGR